MRRKSRVVMFSAVLILLLVGLAEGGSFFSGKFLQSRWKMYRVPSLPPHPVATSFDEYLTIRDSVLGWPLSNEIEFPGRDVRGTGEGGGYPSFDDDDCVSIYGDSFALGTEVAAGDAWGTKLMERTGCPVGIYGVNGYGSDQAYLRYHSRKDDAAQLVILTHLSENIIRNLTRNFDLYTGIANYALKPRFVLSNSGALELQPIPEISEPQYWQYVAAVKPQLILPAENFHVGGPTGEVLLSFPFSYALLRNLFSFRMLSAFRREPDYVQFYRRDDPTRGLEITTEILRSFDAEVRSKGQQPLVVILPTQHDLDYYERRGQWPYANLLENLDAAAVRYIEFGDYVLKNTSRDERRTMFKPLGHYNEHGNLLLAEFVYQSASELLPLPSR